MSQDRVNTGAVRSVAGWTLASRVLGFLRDVVMASILGAGIAADAFFLAWLLPNLARRLFGEGAFTAALIPVFTETREAGDHDASKRLLGASTVRLGLLLLALLLGVEVLLAYAHHHAQTLEAWGLPGADLTLGFARVLLPYLLLICLAGVLGGALNALDRFAVPAAAPVILNLVWIAALGVGALTASSPTARVWILIGGLLIAGLIQLALHVVALERAGLPLRPTWQVEPQRIRRVYRLFGSLALGLAVFQLNVLLDSVIAYAFVPAGGVSALYFANRLVQLPIGVLGIALATAVFPELARRAKRDDHAGLNALVDRGAALGAFIALPAAVGLWLLAEPVVHVLFQRGAFDPLAAQRTARVVTFLAPSILLACISPIVTRGFYAAEDVKVPVRISVVCVVLNLSLNLALVGPLQEAGLALATTISQALNLLLLLAVSLHRRRTHGITGAGREALRATLRSAALAALMAFPVFWTWTLTPLPDLLRLPLAILAGVLTYTLLSLLTRAPELQQLLARVRR